jgi:hypothetical protein
LLEQVLHLVLNHYLLLLQLALKLHLLQTLSYLLVGEFPCVHAAFELALFQLDGSSLVVVPFRNALLAVEFVEWDG